MQCIRCGKEMENTTGGNYHCPSCDMAVNDLVYRPSEWKPFPQGFGEQKGWICPVCGRGVAPWMDYCPCQSDWKITYGTGICVSCEPDEDTRKWINEQRDKLDKILWHKDGSIE